MTTGASSSAEITEAFLNELIAKRRKLLDALDANKGEVNLDIFEDFYPDRAHFVYELLQNAEDAGASQVTFTLLADRLVCEHDGRRTFTEADVTAITGIHNSTKDKSQDRIGKFGVGFKSVFVYTQSPTVRSGEFSFRILEMILPEPIAPDPTIGGRTRFEFPFDNPNKPPSEAYAEIAAGLSELDETTLLFLSNLQAINWRVGDDDPGELLRHGHSESHFEILKRDGVRTTSSSHFLMFNQAVTGFGTHHVAIAFPLDFLPGVREFDADKPLSDQLKIIPASPGRVAVFFVAAKETSGLLFHLHGPFVPELSRASIKETPANEPLFERIAKLCAEALHSIRDLGLLTPDFLSILPNPEDQIPARYRPIRDAIIEEMRSRPLTPTHERNHAAAARLIQAKASLKNLLSEEDIEYLVDYDDEAPLWAMGVTQRNSRIDNFLNGLELREWGASEFISTLSNKASVGGRYIAPHYVTGPDEHFMTWLSKKPPEWLQQLYALLDEEADASTLTHRLKNTKIVRLRDGSFSVAGQCFFASEGADARILTVDELVYTSGRTKPQQDKARDFLSDLGVRELGEAEEVELILTSRYTREAEIPDENTYLRDLKRFIALTESQPEKARLFGPYYVFQGDDESWHTPSGVYLDDPYMPTDLSAYFKKLEGDAEFVALHARYKGFGIPLKSLRLFAEASGVSVGLGVKVGACRDNPQWAYLKSVGGERYTSARDTDYYIPHLPTLLKTPTLELSRLIWRTLTSFGQDAQYLTATFRRSYAGGTHVAESRLVHDLRAASWVPQTDGTFVRPADASREALPNGFSFDPGPPWVKALQFGATAVRQSAQAHQKDAAAKSLGFADAAAAERAKRFNDLPLSDQEQILNELESRGKTAVPDRELANPERRAQHVRDQASKAPDRESETRERSVSLGRDEVKVQADTYLRERYRNSDGDVTCQVCKRALPFKLEDGSDYFETVLFLPKLKKHHPQNYLALCPNHSAMFRFVNGSKETLQAEFQCISGNELPVLLAEREFTIYFSKTHIIDLKAVLEAESDLATPAREPSLDGHLTGTD